MTSSVIRPSINLLCDDVRTYVKQYVIPGNLNGQQKGTNKSKSCSAMEFNEISGKLVKSQF